MKNIEIIERVSQLIGEDIAPYLNILLSLKPDDRPLLASVPGCWAGYVGEELVTEITLSEFVGVIDCETTGLTHKDHVTHAVAIGFKGDKVVSMIWTPQNPGDPLPVYRSVIANWNQPFDRKYYDIKGGVDPNYHIDLMGLALAVRGRPEEWKVKYGPDQTFERYTLTDLSLKTALLEYIGLKIDKSVRDGIIKGTVTSDEIATYCWEDVNHTIMITPIVLGEYLAMAPNPLSIWGHMMRHQFVLPFSPKFEGYYDRSEEWYQKELAYQSSVLFDQMLLSTYSDTPQHTCLREQYPKLSTLTTSKKPRPTNLELPYVRGMGLYLTTLLLSLPPLIIMRGMYTLPNYFAEIMFSGFKPGSAVTVLIMQLTWLGDPILYDRKSKVWYYGPNKEVIPNRGSDDKSLQTPLCKDYEPEVADGVIASENLPQQFRDSMKNCIRWKMFRGRMSGLDITPDGYFIPEYKPTGTLSCRSTDKILLLVGSPKTKYGGSEFMSFIEARPGWKIVQADLDCAELVWAGIVGCMAVGTDAEDGIPFTQANLYGSKEAGTDMHSLTAIQCGIDRGEAKAAIYGGQYGQGVEARIRYFQRAAKCSRIKATEIAAKFKASFIDGLAKPYFDGVKILAANRAPSMLLGRKMPQAYQHASDREGYTSIVNHNIQTLGVDWLDTLQALIYLKSDTDRSQLILTRHDELVYHCREDYTEEFSQIMQWAHRVVKMAILELAGINKPSEQWLSFSSVDVNDRYLKTPDSNPSTVTTQF